EGDLVVVIGSGGVGLSAVQVAKAYGARVLAIDLKEEARKAALDCGADRAVNPKEAPSATQEFADRAGADVAIDLVGTKATLDLARSLLGPGGRFIAVAPGSEAIPVTADDLVDGGKAYLGSYSSTMADFARALALAEAGRLRPVVTRKAPLARGKCGPLHERSPAACGSCRCENLRHLADEEMEQVPFLPLIDDGLSGLVRPANHLDRRRRIVGHEMDNGPNLDLREQLVQ